MHRLLVLAQDHRFRPDAAQEHRHTPPRHQPRVPLVHTEERGRPVRLLPVLHRFHKPAERMPDVAVYLVRLDVDGPRNRCRPLPFVAHLRLAEHHADRRQARPPACPAATLTIDDESSPPERSAQTGSDPTSGSPRPRRTCPGTRRRNPRACRQVEITGAATPLPVPLDTKRHPCSGDQPMAALQPGQPRNGVTARVRTIHTQSQPIRDVLHVDCRRLRAEPREAGATAWQSRPRSFRTSTYSGRTPSGSLAQRSRRASPSHSPNAKSPTSFKAHASPQTRYALRTSSGVVARRLDADARQLANQLPAVVDPAVEHQGADLLATALDDRATPQISASAGAVVHASPTQSPNQVLRRLENRILAASFMRTTARRSTGLPSASGYRRSRAAVATTTGSQAPPRSQRRPSARRLAAGIPDDTPPIVIGLSPSKTIYQCRRTPSCPIRDNGRAGRLRQAWSPVERIGTYGSCRQSSVESSTTSPKALDPGMGGEGKAFHADAKRGGNALAAEQEHVDGQGPRQTVQAPAIVVAVGGPTASPRSAGPYAAERPIRHGLDRIGSPTSPRTEIRGESRTPGNRRPEEHKNQ